MLKQFQKIAPNLKGQITVEDSVFHQLKVIEELDASKSGTSIRSRPLGA